MKKIILLLFLNFMPLYANNITILSLKQCEDSAVKKSPTIKALQYNVQAAQQNLKSKNQSLYPTLTLNAMGSYTAVLPSLSIMGFNETFGDYWGYCVGPTLDYILFDNRARSNNYKSIQNLYESKLQDLEWAKRNIILSVRLQYFQIQAALEKVYILDKRLKLAEKQYKDISINYKSGAKSELDLTMANKQVLTAKNQIELACKNLSKYLRELFELTQDNFNIDPSYPTDYRLNEKQYTNNISCILKVDDVNYSLSQFSVYEKYVFNELNLIL